MVSSWWITKIILTPGAISTGSRWRFLDLVRDSGTEVWFVLLILLGFSIISWTIIVAKALLIRKTRRQSESFFRAYEQQPTFSNIYREIEAQGIQANPFASIFVKGYRELLRISNPPKASSSPQERSVQEPVRLTVEWRGFESVERAVRQEGAYQIHRYEKALSFLATTGSTAPFVGLFGTVLGIIRSFHEIGLRGSASLATVAPGISEALVATAAGLGAAIPAVMAYNLFVQRIRGLSSEMDQFSTELLNLIERQLGPQKSRMPASQAESARRQPMTT